MVIITQSYQMAKKNDWIKKVNVEKLKSFTKEKLYDLNKTGGLDICFAIYFH